MSGRSIPAILWKGWGFLGIGPLPPCWPFMRVLGTVMAHVGVSFRVLMYYNERILRLKIHWKLTCPPSWTNFVLTSLCSILNGYVIPLKVVPCPFPISVLAIKDFRFQAIDSKALERLQTEN